MRKALSLGTVAILVTALSLVLVGTVVAQEPDATPTAEAEPAWGGLWQRVCAGVGIIQEAVAEALGMTPEEIAEERAAGKTLAEVAAERGVTDEELTDALLDSKREVIEQALEEGRITEAQAEWLLAREEALAPFTLTDPFGPHDWAGGGGRGGQPGFDKFIR